jgi:hypothetical protein
MNRDALSWFRPTMQELLNIKQNFQRKFPKKIIFKEIRASSWYCWKALDEQGFLEVISQI